MTLFQYITDNFSNIKEDIKKGLISTSILKHYEIYSRFDYYRKLNNPVTLSVAYTREDFQVSTYCVFKIKKEMESEV
jgi:hypothetical protein